MASRAHVIVIDAGSAGGAALTPDLGLRGLRVTVLGCEGVGSGSWLVANGLYGLLVSIFIGELISLGAGWVWSRC